MKSLSEALLAGIQTASSNGTNNTPDAGIPDYRAEDGGVLDVWLRVHGDDHLFVAGHDEWRVWTGTHWRRDEELSTRLSIQSLLDRLNQEASAMQAQIRREIEAAGALGADDALKAREKMLRAYVSCTKRTKSRVLSIEHMAATVRATPVHELGALNVLNLRNGTLDLDTLELHPHDRDDHLTYCLDYEFDVDADAPRFSKYLEETLVDADSMRPDWALIESVVELMGYSLTNDTSHEYMVWLAGEGGNGKTVLIEVLQSLLGDLAISIDFETLGKQGDYQLADIPDRRVLFSTESERGARLPERHIKKIATGERIRARAIYGSAFEFRSTAKIWWAMNDKPVVRDTGNSVWRRLKLIPFNREFSESEKDTTLTRKLKEERPGILNLALAALRRVRERGHFTEAAASRMAAEHYKRQSNPVYLWLEERAIDIDAARENDVWTMASELFDDYRGWCTANARTPLNSTNFGLELGKLKIEKKRKGSGQHYNIGLLAQKLGLP